MITQTIADLKRMEWFSAKPYQCTEGVWTIGYGFTNMTEEEAETILSMRVEDIHRQLSTYRWYLKLNSARKQVIINMAFQLGMAGLFGFKNMIRALTGEYYVEAGVHMKDSKWYQQTPDRAQELIDRMRTGK